ncbi:MAG: hypothetical protein OCU16_03985 [Candidatus Methanospirare jalkutatii]|nr:hypothetical protein [Candidatus Methanospirare jalkutatii]
MLESLSWLFFLASSFLLGLAVLSVLSIRLAAAERAVFSFVVGSTFSVWLAYILALSLSLSDAIFGSTALCFLLSLAFFCIRRKQGKFVLKELAKLDKKTSIFLASVLIYVLVMNLCCVLRPDSEGNLHAMVSVWGDYPFHTSIITSFAYGNNIPPVYLQFSGKPMHYPVLMDFLSALLLLSLDIRTAILLPNVLFQFCLFASLFFLSLRLTGNRIASALSCVLFIFSGYPPGLDAFNIHFLNPIYAVILPQRTAIFGMSISFIVYSLLFHAFFEQSEQVEGEERGSERREGLEWQNQCSVCARRRELFLAGTLIGLLPYIHAHSFIVTTFVSLFLAVFASLNALRRGRSAEFVRVFPALIFLLAPLFLFALPQVLAIRTQVSENFFMFYPGWTDKNRDIILEFNWSGASAIISFILSLFLMLKFWILNLNVLSFLIPLGFYEVKRAVKIFYMPFLLVFVVANIVKFQPWYWDNYKLFLHWFSLSVVLAGFALLWMCERLKKFKRGVLTGILSVSVLSALLFSATFFGAVTHAFMFYEQPTLWTPADFEVAAWVRENTHPESVFLTAGGQVAHNHPVPALAGRRILLGYEGWLWSHGFNWSEMQEVKRAEIKMFSGELSLFSKYGVDYVCVGPYEEDFARVNRFKINISALNNALDLKYERVFHVDGREVRWRIYEVR